MKREVAGTVVVEVTAPAELVFSVAVSDHFAPTAQAFTPTLDGQPVPFTTIPDAHLTRLHRIESGTGRLQVAYSATIEGFAPFDVATPTDLVTYVRPSRYAESDILSPMAAGEFAGIADPVELLAAVSSWVGTRLSYVPGSSLPTDGAVRTLLARQGVCRDYAHLCVALLRALGIPARLASVYAPGLAPMDFHAVAEAWVDGAWRVVDATALAPRTSLVRIATGRDAADTAFLNVLSGRADLLEVSVTAVVDVLPLDDVTQLVSLY